MKRIRRIITFLLISVILTGCGTIENPIVAKQTKTTEDGDLTKQETDYTFQAEVLDVDVTLLVTPDADSNEARTSDKISVTVSEDIKNTYGDVVSMEQIKPGDFVQITYDGTILESYPAQITAKSILLTGHNDLIDGYMALIDHIYQDDPALNSEISMIALDTTGWSGLTEIEKELIFTLVQEAYGFEIKEGTYDELAEQGLINKEQLYFEKGVLIKLENVKYDESKKEITCAISKWRSGLGAIGSDDAAAKLKDGVWNIELKNQWIS